MDYLTAIKAYTPKNEQEETDKAFFLAFAAANPNCLLRENDAAHFTASAWCVNQAHDKVLMVYHNIYDSFSWTGGHADGEQNLLHKAMEEAKEETGIITLIPLTGAILSIDVLPVKVHVKRGKEIKAHQHYNIAYGFIASDKELLQIKPDENSNVCWIALDDWQSRCNEAHMVPVYE